MKKISVLLIIAGVLLLSYGGYEWWSSKAKESSRLEEAKKILQMK